MKIILLLWLSILIISSADAQKIKQTIQQPSIGPAILRGQILGKGKVYPDRIALRWNIDNYQLFKQLLLSGVLIDRLELDKNDKASAAGWVRVSKDTVRAVALKDFNTSELKKDTAVMIMAQTIYGKMDYPRDMSLYQQLKVQDEAAQNRYVVASLYSALSPKAALLGGLGFEDIMAPEADKKYVYRISPAHRSSSGDQIDTGFIYVIGKDLASNPVYSGVRAVNMDGQIVLKWPKENSPFSGYYIERSRDARKFIRITKNIYLPSTDTSSNIIYYYFADSVANYTTFYYRVTGVNAFGEQKVFADTVRGMAVDRTAPASPFMTFVQKGKQVTFQWNKTSDHDVKGYYLLKGNTSSASDSTAVSTLISPLIIHYSLAVPDDFRSSYYRLLVADTAGNTSFSNSVYVFVPDTVPPAAPLGLKGTIDTSGLVTLQWNLGAGEALRGFKVLAANQEDHSFIPVSDIVSDTTFSFITTLNTLTKHLFIKVLAIDGNFNQSTLSVALKLNRPDTIAPPQPAIVNYYNSTKGVRLEWSEDKSEDFYHYVLYRRVEGDSSWKNICTTKKITFSDSTVLAGKHYDYVLKSFDSSGLASAFSFPLHVKASAGIKPALTALTVNFNEDSKKINLKWDRLSSPVNAFVLYKDTGKGLSLYKYIAPTEYTYTENCRGIKVDTYAIKVVYADKSESEITLFNKN